MSLQNLEEAKDAQFVNIPLELIWCRSAQHLIALILGGGEYSAEINKKKEKYLSKKDSNLAAFFKKIESAISQSAIWKMIGKTRSMNALQFDQFPSVYKTILQNTGDLFGIIDYIFEMINEDIKEILESKDMNKICDALSNYIAKLLDVVNTIRGQSRSVTYMLLLDRCDSFGECIGNSEGNGFEFTKDILKCARRCIKIDETIFGNIDWENFWKHIFVTGIVEFGKYREAFTYSDTIAQTLKTLSVGSCDPTKQLAEKTRATRYTVDNSFFCEMLKIHQQSGDDHEEVSAILQYNEDMNTLLDRYTIELIASKIVRRELNKFASGLDEDIATLLELEKKLSDENN